MGTPVTFVARKLLDSSNEALEDTVKNQCTRFEDGKYLLPTSGDTMLSQAERESVANRLLKLKISAVVEPLESRMSTAVDAADLANRLLDVDEAEFETRFAAIDATMCNPANSREELGTSTTIHDHETLGRGLDVEKCILAAEQQAFDELQQDGCRPMVGQELLNEEHHVLVELIADLGPWNTEWHFKVGGYPLTRNNRSVLQRQRHKWQLFRIWQYLNRQLQVPQLKDFADFFADRRQVDEAGGLQLREETWSTYVDFVRQQWNLEQEQFKSTTSLLRAISCDDWYQYVAAVQQRLVDIKCYLDFSPSPDPTDQDEITTWIKYFIFELIILEDIEGAFDMALFKRDIDWLDLYSEDFIDRDDTPENLTSRATVLKQLQDANDGEEEANEQIKRVQYITDTEPYSAMIAKSEAVALWTRWNLILGETVAQLKDLERAMRRISEFLRLQNEYVDCQQKHDFQQKFVQWGMNRVRLLHQERFGEEGENVRF